MSRQTVRKFLSWCLCLCLCAAMLSPVMAEPADGNVTDMMTALPTPTPVPTPAPSQAGTVAPSPAETREPSRNETTEEPSAAQSPVPTDSINPPESAAPAESQSPTDSAAPTESLSPTDSVEPTESLSPTDSAMPTESQSPTDSAAPTESPSPTVSPAPTVSDTPAPAWDESQCDHVNEHCERAPKCGIAGCAHIGLDENGNVIALCPLGEWLFAAADAEQAAASGQKAAARSASAPMGFALKNGVNMLYRSGTYELTGGGDQAELYVRAGVAVSFALRGVQLKTLHLNAGVAAVIGFDGDNAIATVAAQNAAVSLRGRGSLSVTNLNCDALTVASAGSVRLPGYAASRNQYRQWAFDAAGTTSATVDGDAIPYTGPSADGKAYLWLPEPGQGLPYTARLEGTRLIVASMPEQPTNQNDYDLSSAAEFQARQDQAYQIIAGANPQSKTLRVNQTGVSLSLSNIGNGSYAPSVEADQPATLFLSGQNALNRLSGSAAMTLSGSGSVSVQEIAVSSLTVLGPLTLSCGTDSSGALSGWQSVTADGDLSLDTAAIYQGKQMPLCFMTSNPRIGFLPLPAPAPGYRYQATLQGGKLNIAAVESAAQLMELTNAGLPNLGSGNYLLRGGDGVTGDVVIPASAKVKLTLENVRTTGSLRLGEGASVSIAVLGASRFGGTVTLGKKASLSVSGTGSLYAGSVSGGAGCSTTVGNQTSLTLGAGAALPGSKLKPTVIFVTDSANNPMLNREVTLKLGREKPFTTNTGANGHITLWRSKALTKVDAVVLSESETYATILSGGMGAPDALPGKISDEQRKDENGSHYVTFTAAGGKTMGIQYYVREQAVDMPDTFAPDAGVAYMKDGRCVITGLKDGSVVTYRAFASASENAALSADTADAFTFGEQHRFTVRFLQISKQTKEYDGKAFPLNKKLLPSGVSQKDVKYYSGNELLPGAPVNAGQYIAKVTVPEGHPDYLPGVYSVDIDIARRPVYIYPEPASKLQGEEDPPFFYTYSEMIGDDEVTGWLIRVKGEWYGNYAYLPDWLSATGDNYDIRIDPDTPAFFIDWGPHHYMPYDPFARIDPVYDELRFSDGSKLKTQIRTNEQLKIGDVYYGELVTDTQDHKDRPITPTLRLRGGYDDALLILTAEAELNEDGGYQTDADGKRMVRGRQLTLSYATLNRLKTQNINYLAFSLNGVSVLVNLEDLRGCAKLDKLMEDNGISRIGTKFLLILEPVGSEGDLAEGEASAADAARLSEPLMRVGIYLENNGRRVDISSALTGARMLFDASGLLEDGGGDAPEPDGGDITETVMGKRAEPTQPPLSGQEAAAIAGAKGEAETTAELLEVAQSLLIKQIGRFGYTLMRYGERASVLDSTPVVPYTSSESNAAMFRALMRTKPYLAAAFDLSGLYGLTAQSR